jgi:hypothetical protein
MKTKSPHPSAAASPAAKLDLYKLHAAEYVAPRQPALVQTRPARHLAVGGEGAPGGEVFQSRIGALYAVAFTVKMTRKFAGLQDYTVGRLEARYFMPDRKPLPPMSAWRWQLLIRTPDFIAPADLEKAVAALHKRGKEGDAALVALETIDEGACVQMLHVGPYGREEETLAIMRRFADGKGLRFAGPHHEIYLSDPRRVAPEKLKTILRLPVAPA